MPNPDGIVQAQDLCLEAVTTPSIASAAVTTTKIANLAVGTAKIGSAAITTAKIGNLAVDTAQINTAAVTKLKVGDQEIDIQRMLDPIGWDRDHDSASNVSLTTTWESLVTTTVSVPSWAGSVLQSAAGLSQVQGGSTSWVASAVVLSASTSDPSGALTQTVRNGEVDGWGETDSTLVSSPGATITSQLWSRISSGSTSQSSNFYALDMQCLFKR